MPVLTEAWIPPASLALPRFVDLQQFRRPTATITCSRLFSSSRFGWINRVTNEAGIERGRRRRSLELEAQF